MPLDGKTPVMASWRECWTLVQYWPFLAGYGRKLWVRLRALGSGRRLGHRASAGGGASGWRRRVGVGTL